jgi:hypothetical protein
MMGEDMGDAIAHGSGAEDSNDANRIRIQK